MCHTHMLAPIFIYLLLEHIHATITLSMRGYSQSRTSEYLVDIFLSFDGFIKFNGPEELKKRIPTKI